MNMLESLSLVVAVVDAKGVKMLWPLSLHT